MILIFHEPIRGGPLAFQHLRRRTYALVTDESNPMIGALAYAECSESDQFSRRRGREIAIGRAAKGLRLGATTPPESFGLKAYSGPRREIAHAVLRKLVGIAVGAPPDSVGAIITGG